MRKQADYFRRAAEAYIHGQFRRSLRIAKRGLLNTPEDLDLKKLAADSQHALGNVAEARAIYTWLLERDGSNMDYHFGYANACYRCNTLAEAREHFEVVLRQDPLMLAARALLAHVFLKQNEEEPARALIAEGLKMMTGTERAEDRAILFGVKGLLEYRDGDDQAARKTVVQAVRLSPGDRALLEQLALLNRRATGRSRRYTITVEGTASALASQAGVEVVFIGACVAIADSREEALEYFKEVQVYADPESLRVTRCTEQSARGSRYKGVMLIAPSVSFEIMAKETLKRPCTSLPAVISSTLH